MNKLWINAILTTVFLQQTGLTTLSAIPTSFDLNTSKNNTTNTMINQTNANTNYTTTIFSTTPHFINDSFESLESTSFPGNGSTTNRPDYPTTNPPNDTTTNHLDSSATESLAGNSTKLPNDTYTDSPDLTPTKLPEDTTTEPPAGKTTKFPNDTYTDPPDLTTTNLPDDTTMKLPDDPTTNPPNDTTTNHLDSSVTEPLAGNTTKLPNDTYTDSSDLTPTNLPEDTTTEPSAANTTKLPNYTSTDPQDSTTNEPVTGTITNLPDGSTPNLPYVTTTNLPNATTTSLPYSTSTNKLDGNFTNPTVGSTIPSTTAIIDPYTNTSPTTTMYTALPTPSTTTASPTPSTTTASPTTTNKTTTTARPTTSSTTIPPLVCINGGELQSGVCICPDEWTGETCSKQNFCYSIMTGAFSFPKTTIGWFGYSAELCPENTKNAGLSKASARCLNDTGSPRFDVPQVLMCDLTLSEINENISSGSGNFLNLVFSTQILTSKPEQLSADSINTAAEIANKLLNSTTNITQDIAVAAITTISQLLNASEERTQNSNAIKSLTVTLEQFSLKQQSNVSLIVQPNLVVQSAQVPTDTVGIKFTAFTGRSSNFVANRIQLNTNSSEQVVSNEGPTDVQMVIKYTPVLSREDTVHSVGFVLYQNDNFFKSKAFQASLGTSRRVLSANFGKISGLDVEMLFKPTSVPNVSLYDFACVSWNYTLDDWSTYGCSKVNDTADGLHCFCNHTTNFAVLMTFRKDFLYIESLNWISVLGCSLSITGLGLTIIFQIVTRKSRKTTPTLLLVSLCTSLLISTLLFMLAVENPNKQLEKPKIKEINNIPSSDLHTEPDTGPCTVVTALLQFFLLGTFTWSTLYATHIFLMVRNVLASTPQHFIIYTMVIGWGMPAIIVALSLGICYRRNNPLGYRQEEFCWLAALDSNGNVDFKQPLFWGFLIPVAFMLIVNTLLLMHFAVATSRTNPNLNSTRRDSMKKKILRNFSLAVVLSLSWILGYFLLITHDETVYTVLNIFFCILTTTQGLQIFILFTARTAIVKKKISSALKAVSSVDIPLCTMTYRLRQDKQIETVESYTELDNGL